MTQAAVTTPPISYEQRPLQTPLRRRKPIEFSSTGLVYCTLTVFMGLAAMNSQVNLLFGVFGMMMGILLVSGVIGRIALRRLSITRILPEHGIVGRPITLGYEIHNGKRFWPSMSVTLAELDGVEAFAVQPQAYMLQVAADTSAMVATEILAKRRGFHHLDRYQIATSFPFGFIRRSVTASLPDSVLVYPAIGRVDPRIIQLCHARDDLAGAPAASRPGGADEFYGVKEFRDGDSPRRIYWRRSARTGTLVAKEMTHVAPPRLLLLVDTHLNDTEPESRATVERVIAMAASLIEHAMAEGMPVGLVAWSNGWIHIAPSRGKMHRRDLLSALACLAENTECTASRLISQAKRQQKFASNAVLLTSRQSGASVIPGSDVAVLAADSPVVSAGFVFHRAVDFNRCTPEEKSDG